MPDDIGLEYSCTREFLGCTIPIRCGCMPSLLLYMRFLHGACARARQRLITELVSFHELWKETTGNLNTKMLVQQKPQLCFIGQLLAN